MSLIQGVDVVFHLACLGVRHSIHSPQENHDVNASATLGLLALSRDANVGRFIYVSSSEVYGSIVPVPPMSEMHHTQPLTVYGASKLAGECYTRAFYHTYGYPTVVLRPFNAYGPRSHHEGDCGEVIPKFMLRCMAGRPLIVFGDGTQTRDFTYVADTARGIIMAATCDAAVGTTINLGSGREISVNELARLVAEVVGCDRAEVIHDFARPGDVPRLLADISKARRLLGFEPNVTLRQGLASLKQWYLNQGEAPSKALERESVRNWELAASPLCR